jgi:hypothetical protein
MGVVQPGHGTAAAQGLEPRRGAITAWSSSRPRRCSSAMEAICCGVASYVAAMGSITARNRAPSFVVDGHRGDVGDRQGAAKSVPVDVGQADVAYEAVLAHPGEGLDDLLERGVGHGRGVWR